MKEDLLPAGPWPYTDDTEMALAIYEVIEATGHIDQAMLGKRIVTRYSDNLDRGYGKGIEVFCKAYLKGMDWEEASHVYKGGSKGNGSAKRVAPLGAYYAERAPEVVVAEATKSAEVTHRHPEGVAGAVAVALAAAVAWRQRIHSISFVTEAIFESLLEHLPSESLVRKGIATAAKLEMTTPPDEAARILGNGLSVTCPDTVPYAIWSACRHLNDFKAAMLETLFGGGDADTNCAIVGGIVSLYAGQHWPDDWMDRREALKFHLPPES
jgi:ADP-ribosylglycohydrolase